MKRSLAKSLRPQDIVGTWVNELGSVMVIEAATGQSFSGSYRSAVSAGGAVVTGSLHGTVADDSIAFNVNWQPAYQSLTSWTGLVLADPAGDQCIYALWQLTCSVDSEEDWWQAINAGADLFTRA